MIKLTQNTRTGGDCTAGYAVTLDKEYTVEEFITEVLTKNEWGYIGIDHKDRTWFSRGSSSCEYRQDKLISPMLKEILPRKIDNVIASGGYSRMDYILKLKK